MTMVKKRGLGRGLTDLGISELLSDISAQAGRMPIVTFSAQPGERPLAPHTHNSLPTQALQPGKYQPRRQIEDATLTALAESMQAHGILQPIVVRPAGTEGRYEIIAGERRWRAALRLGLTEVPVSIKILDDTAAMAIGLIENIQRENLNALEEARGIQRLLTEFSLTHDAVAKHLGRSRAMISNLLRLLQLAPKVAEALEQGKLSMGHARALLALDDGQQQQAAAEHIIQYDLSVRATEEKVRRLQIQASNGPSVDAADSADFEHAAFTPNDAAALAACRVALKQLQAELTRCFNMPAVLRPTHELEGPGKLIVSYTSQEELSALLARLNKE